MSLTEEEKKKIEQEEQYRLEVRKRAEASQTKGRPELKGCSGCLVAFLIIAFVMTVMGKFLTDSSEDLERMNRELREKVDQITTEDKECTVYEVNPTCAEHIELLGADFWAKEFGKSEMSVLANHRINLWKNKSPNKHPVVGKMRVGSRALILSECEDDYKVRSPLDGSEGYIGKSQVKRLVKQNTETRKPCS